MAAFEYQALDGSGKTVKGITTGDHAKQVRGELRAQGLTPLAVKSVSEGAATRSQNKGNASRRIKIGTNDLSILTRQMATLLNSGMTVEETLSAMIKQSEGHKVKSIMSDIRSLVTEGYSLSDAIAMYPRSFPEIYRASISAGEQSGTLDDVLERLADYLETRHSVQQRISMALIYPLFLTFASLSIVIALVAFVVPKVVKVFEDTGQELPVLTQILISMSEFLQSYGLLLLLALVGLGFLCSYIFRQEKPKFWLHNNYLNLIGIKRMSKNMNAARMARTLSIMVGSGVPLLASMRASEGVLANVVLQQDLSKAAEEVSQGVSISRALDRSGHFPPLLVQMVASGENSGKLDHMLEKAASATESEMEARISMMVGLFEPIMILVMGLTVLVIVLAILLPIFDLNTVLA
ncbi:MAG: type II secretion system inner membrane protein GspF [Pseudomonadota bacterium]